MKDDNYLRGAARHYVGKQGSHYDVQRDAVLIIGVMIIIMIIIFLLCFLLMRLPPPLSPASLLLLPPLPFSPFASFPGLSRDVMPLPATSAAQTHLLVHSECVLLRFYYTSAHAYDT
ncbi:hypothetical protein CRENBAI_000898 [Crenichthys baileyi]|uniref:Uncharacterized protein n=1 Tax=Crenichthys baileyi TaxID=28760 RepID=A0AAV9RWF7_9TELE